MALALQVCGRYHWSGDRIQPSRYVHGDNYSKGGLSHRRALADNLSCPITARCNTRLSCSRFCKEFLVAAPRQLSSSSKRRGQELRMQTKERADMVVSEWIKDKMKDHLVEVDPVTIGEKIAAEFHASELSEAGMASTTIASPYTTSSPDGNSRGFNRMALAAVALFLLAIAVSIIQATRSIVISKLPHKTVNGGFREKADLDVVETITSPGVSESSLKDELRATEILSDTAAWDRPGMIVNSNESQPSFKPISSYSTYLDQSDLPLPPSFSSSVPSKRGSIADESIKLEKDNLMSEPAPNLIFIPAEANSSSITDTEPAAPVATSSFEGELSSGKFEELVVTEDGIGSLQASVTEQDQVLAGPERKYDYEMDEVVSETPGVFEYTFREELWSSQGGNGKATAVVNSVEAQVVECESYTGTGIHHSMSTGEKPSTGSLEDHAALFKDPAALSSERQKKLTEEQRESFKKSLQAALPVAMVGVGAVGAVAGVDGGLEVVGLAATASFITYELLWAQSRQKLWAEWKRVTDHNKFLEFLKSRKIVIDVE